MVKKRKSRPVPFRAALWGALLIGSSAHADLNSQTFTYQGRFLNPFATAPLSDTVDVTFGIYDPSGTCLLYEEKQDNIDLSTTLGVFSVQIGSGTPPSADAGKRTANDIGKSMAEIFSNAGALIAPNSASCALASGYTPQPKDKRLLRVTVYNQATAETTTLTPDQVINSAPQAAAAETLQGLVPSQFIQITGNGSTSYTVTKSALDVLTGAAGGGAASDASTAGLHHHDSVYAKLGDTGSFSTISSSGAVSAGSFSTTGAVDAGSVTTSGAVSAASFSGSGASLTNLNASNISSGTIGSAYMPAFSGDIVSSAGTTSTSIAAGAVTNAKLADGSVTLAKLGSDVGAWSVNGASAYRSAGNVGIGITNPSTALDVSGAIRSAYTTSNTTSVDFSRGNTQFYSGNCGSAINMTNLQPGATYTLIVTDTTTTACSFQDNGTAVPANSYMPANGPRVNGRRTVYSFIKASATAGDVLISWVPGFQ